MSQTAERYATVAQGFGTRLVAVPSDRWEAPTPCTEWTVRDLVTHVIATHRRVLATLDGTEPPDVDPAGDLAAAWDAASVDMAQALADPERASRVIGGMFGEQPFESLVGRLVCSDTLVHTWDLARATGQDERLDPSSVEASLEFLAPLDDAIRRPGGFAPKVATPGDADLQVRLLHFCGRAC